MIASRKGGGGAGSIPDAPRAPSLREDLAAKNDDKVTMSHDSHAREAPPLGGGETARLMKLASHAAVGVAVVLILAKLVAWVMTDSVALLGSLMDSGLDAFASLINLLAIRHALVPADREHRFGHGKAEALAGLAQAAFITGSSMFLLLEVANRAFRPHPVAAGEIGVAVLVFSILLTLALVLFQRSVVKRTGSLAIAADSLHYKGDLLMNLGVILALVLGTRFGLIWADPLIGFAIAIYLLHGAWRIFAAARDHLMDRELSDDLRRRIREIAVGHARVIDMHDLRTRASGTHTFIQMHLEMDPAMALLEAHEISDEVEAWIREEFQDAEVIIHQDPYGVEEERAVFGR